MARQDDQSLLTTEASGQVNLRCLKWWKEKAGLWEADSQGLNVTAATPELFDPEQTLRSSGCSSGQWVASLKHRLAPRIEGHSLVGCFVVIVVFCPLPTHTLFLFIMCQKGC
jgi:hypothetical protein